MTAAKLEYTTIDVRTQGPVVQLRLDRAEAGNTLDHRMVAELSEALDWLEDERPGRVLVLRGGPDAFCGGVDWVAFEDGQPPDVHAFRRVERIAATLERL